MGLVEDNFKEAAKLDENAVVRIQSVIQLLEENTSTRIKLKNAQVGGSSIGFDMVEGSIEDVKRACGYNGVEHNGNTLVA